MIRMSSSTNSDLTIGQRRRAGSVSSSSWPCRIRGAGSSWSTTMAACGWVCDSRCARAAGLSVRIVGLPPLEAAPASTEGLPGERGAVALSTTSATMQVMLSGPPPRMASSTSCRTASSGSGTVARVRCSVSSLTTPDSPSEHSRYRSPACASSIDRSGSASEVPSRARSSSDRCGWVAASSGLIRPSSTSDWTRVWSWVICWNSPPDST